MGPEFNRAAEFARKAAEESASASAFSKEAYKRSVTPATWRLAPTQFLGLVGRGQTPAVLLQGRGGLILQERG